jgi:hypothetical protein
VYIEAVGEAMRKPLERSAMDPFLSRPLLVLDLNGRGTDLNLLSLKDL